MRRGGVVGEDLHASRGARTGDVCRNAFRRLASIHSELIDPGGVTARLACKCLVAVDISRHAAVPTWLLFDVSHSTHRQIEYADVCRRLSFNGCQVGGCVLASDARCTAHPQGPIGTSASAAPSDRPC